MCWIVLAKPYKYLHTVRVSFKHSNMNRKSIFFNPKGPDEMEKHIPRVPELDDGEICRKP